MKSVDVQKKLYEIVRSEIPTHNVQEDCMYLSKDNIRFCRQTSQKSCKGCNFYEPNIRTKINLVVEAMIRMEGKYNADLAQMRYIHQTDMKRMADIYDSHIRELVKRLKDGDTYDDCSS